MIKYLLRALKEGGFSLFTEGDKTMFGIGLIVNACRLVLRFADRYYRKNKANYSEPQQTALEALFAAAEAVSVAVTIVVGP